jgi:carbonic anhydrase
MSSDNSTTPAVTETEQKAKALPSYTTGTASVE